MLPVATATALALLVAAAPADLLPAGVSWTWQAPAGCPAEATTRRELAGATRTACSLAADAVAKRDAAGWRLELRVRLQDRSDARTLTASTCRALADAAIVIVAVACTEDALRSGPVAAPIDPPEPPPVVPAPPGTSGTSGTPADDLPKDPRVPAGDPPSIAPPTPRQGLRPAPLASPPPRRGLRPLGELGLRGGVAGAPTLAPAGLLGLALRLRWRRVELVLSGAYTSARTTRYPQLPALGVATRLAHAGLAVCPALEWGRGLARGRGALCAVFEAGAMFGTGVGAPDNVTRARPWVAAGAAPTLGWLPHPRISLGLGVDLLVSVVRPAFQLEDLEPLVRAAPFGVRLHTTIYLRLF